MSKQSARAMMANAAAKKIVAEQTRVRLVIGFDAALIAAHEVLQLGPGRAQAFANAYSDAMNELAELFISDCDENHDKQIVYAKAKRDELIRSIVGEANFVPFDVSYGNAVMDELKRVRVINDQ